MAQRFNVNFPKYHFVLQKEFKICFDGKIPLPFSYWISSKGKCYVEDVYYNDTRYTKRDIEHWKALGLQKGLTIISINNEKLLDEDDDDDDSDNDEDDMSYYSETNHSVTKHKSNLEEILQSITNDVNISQIDIIFREELMSADDCKPFGLSYKSDIDIINDEKKEYEMIKDRKITASSYETNFEHKQCRLNNPYSYWKPSKTNENLGNIWICIDLNMQRAVTKLHIQGSLDHTSYVTKLWIDYSDDCCNWICHGLQKCKYIDIDGYQYKTAEIKIWPTIHCQFVRIRPYEWQNHIAMRMEVYGTKREYNEYCRTVTLDTVNERDQSKLLKLVTNKPRNTKAVQLDCKAIITTALERARISSYGILNTDENHYICTFTTPNSHMTERAMDSLAESGMGTEIGILSTTQIAYQNVSINETNDGSLQQDTGGATKKPGFYASIQSRMVVKQVVERIMQNTAFTFDYFAMLLVASLIAVGGLATDSAVIVVASMLVSPIMGPVLAFTFGVTLKDKNMAKLGLKNELLSLIICVITGLIVGFFWIAFTSKENKNWPTDEMKSRGEPEALISGAFIAAASGVGVALSVLGEYLSTVIGVAISASLLPPAVNCGMLLSLSFYAAIPSTPIDNKREYINEAGWSLLLTIENIFIIFAVGRLMFWVKNVYMTHDQNTAVWEAVIGFKQKYSQYMAEKNDSNEVNIGLSKRRTGVAFIDDTDNEYDDERFVMKQLRSDGVVDNIDVYIEPGTDADRCMDTVKNVLMVDNKFNTNTDSTLKGILMRQASNIDMNDTESREDAKSIKTRPKIADIFKNDSYNDNEQRYQIVIQEASDYKKN